MTVKVAWPFAIRVSGFWQQEDLMAVTLVARVVASGSGGEDGERLGLEVRRRTELHGSQN